VSQEDVGLRRGRPLHLRAERMERVQQLWREHQVAKEVTRIRISSDRVIRESYY
jgi:hypothetical protein